MSSGGCRVNENGRKTGHFKINIADDGVRRRF